MVALQERELSCPVQSLVLSDGKYSHIPQVDHEGGRAPTQDPLDVKGGESHSVQGHTGPNTERMGAPSAEVLGITNRVEMVDFRGQAAHEALNIIRTDELGTGVGVGPIHREGGGVRPQPEVADRKALEMGEGTIDRGDKAETSKFGVFGK